MDGGDIEVDGQFGTKEEREGTKGEVEAEEFNKNPLVKIGPSWLCLVVHINYKSNKKKH